jgi:ArsR family transcriptional regulator, lead/cadmium/zinc/bismuth-responsive transcriptional repressor
MLMYSYSMASETRPTRDEHTLPGEACSGEHARDAGVIEALRERLLAVPTVESIADVFKLLGDPTRVRLVDALSHGERCVCDLSALVNLSESAVSHQLRLLRAARLVRVRRAGRLAYYSLDDHHVVGLLYDTRRHVEEGRA